MQQMGQEREIARDFHQSNPQIEKEVSSSSSITARAGQVMAIIISLGVISMIASMLVSESISGDPSQINRAGILRMQAVKISRALVEEYNANQSNNNQSNTNQSANHYHLISEEKAAETIKEVALFEESLGLLFKGGVANARSDDVIESQYQIILASWQNLKQSQFYSHPHPKPQAGATLVSYDQFVEQIDELVTLLQQASEKKLAMLRLIQGISLLGLVTIAVVVLYQLNKTVIIPLKELVEVAELAGKGDFSLKASYDSDNELGVLARTINRMSEELELSYQDYEQRVATKTRALINGNRSLQVLYQAASRLASSENQRNDSHIIKDLEAALDIGKVTIERMDPIDTSAETLPKGKLQKTEKEEKTHSLKRIEFPLEKAKRRYGQLVWHIPGGKQPRKWQTQMLQAMADIIATAFYLEQKRGADDRLLIVEERAVIARELHDSLAQSLSYLKVQMSLLTRKMQKQASPDIIEETISDIKQGLNAAYRQLRELLTTFRLKLDDPSLANALQGTVVEFAEKCQHPIALDFNLPENCLSANKEVHVLQIIREALSNVHRHARASNAGVSLRLENERRLIEIWDDGVGIDFDKNKVTQLHTHFGLGIMEERAKSLQTNIIVGSREPNGTRILFEF